MLQVACRDVGVDCDAVISGNTVEEVKRKAFEHAAEVHADLMKTMTPEQLAELEKAVVSKIR